MMTGSSVEEQILKLTPAQQMAVNWGDGPLLVLAGPGSGKTRVLTSRIARILTESSNESFRVLALTFTNKAADEMMSRVLELVPEMERRLVVGTFHSFCMQVLQQHGTHVGIESDFMIYSLDSDRLEILNEAMRATNTVGEPTAFLRFIDRLKSQLIAPEDCQLKFRDRVKGEIVRRVYSAYENELLKSNALDFGSLIVRTFQLIRDYQGVANHLRKTYRYWLIDEFQDTTNGQYSLIKAMAGDGFRNIFSVADDDQIIYQWNGASYAQLQRFRTDFSPSEIQLPTNYRCPPFIVELANRLISHNSQRTESKMPLIAGKVVSHYPESTQVSLSVFETEQDEAAAVARTIKTVCKSPFEQIVILGRNRSILDGIQGALTKNSVRSVIALRRDDFSSPAYQWLHAVLKLVMRPFDRLVLAELTDAFNRWYSVSSNAVEIFESANLTGCTLLEEWASSTEGINLPAQAQQLVSASLRCNRNRDSYRELIAAFDSLAGEPEANTENSDLIEDKRAWQEIARSVYRSLGYQPTLDAFLQEVAMRSKEPPPERGVVTLMTIHGAKGKEFDEVFLVGIAEELLPSFQSIRAGQNSNEMEEERRNCFVAITRAKERLHLSYSKTYKGYSKKPSRFLTEMGLSAK